MRYVSCMPISKWKVSNHARVKLTLTLCCVASKGHGIKSLGDITITASAGKQQHCGCPWSEPITICLHPNKRDQSSSYKVLCWIVDILCRERGRRRDGGHLTSWRLSLGCRCLHVSADFSGALCNLLKCFLYSMHKILVSRRHWMRQCALCVLQGAVYMRNIRCFLFDVPIYL